MPNAVAPQRMSLFSNYRHAKLHTRLREKASRSVAGGMDQIVSYFEKKLGKMYQMPGIERYENSKGHGIGLRYFFANGWSVRFNWKGGQGVSDIESVDVWNGSSHDPNFEIVVKGTSLVKVLPDVVALIRQPVEGANYVVAESVIQPLTEAPRGAEPESVYRDLMDIIGSHQWFSGYKMQQVGRTLGASIWRKILRDCGEMFDQQTQGHKTLYKLKDEYTEESFDKDDIIGDLVEIDVGPGGVSERYTSPEMARLAAEAKKAAAIPYEEQLEDMKSLIKAVVRGASNALFIAGRGGLGKTHTVEETLHALGLEDGNGYFKNTTSASASGMYKTLYDHRNSIIVFDDCDNAFKDQESRNLLKAASDTKKARKLAWNKNSSWLYKGNPEDLPDEDDDSDPEDKLYPRYFEFEGRIIFISNLAMDQIDPDGALRTRGFIISIDPTDEEVLTFMEKILPNIRLEDGLKLSLAERKRAFEVLKEGGREGLNIRKLVRSLNIAAIGVPNWEQLARRYA